MKNFIKLAVNPYFNNKRNLKPIIKALIEIKSEYYKNPEFDISAHLKKTLSIKPRALWNRLSELKGIAEYFLLLNELESNKLKRKEMLLNVLFQRKLYNIIRLEKVPSEKIIQRSKLDNNTFYTVSGIYKNFSSYNSEQNNYNESAELNNLQAEFSLMSYLIHLYKHLLDTELQERNNLHPGYNISRQFLNMTDHTGMLDAVKKKHPVMAIPIDIYYNLYLSFKESNGDKHYNLSRDLFLKNKHLFSNDFKNDIYQSLRNYCIEMTNKGISGFYKEIFKLNNSIINEGLFKDLNVVNSSTNNFRNFIFAALRLNEFGWINEFIKQHSIELPEDIREDEINLNTGILKIYEKEYNEALNYLNKVKRKRYLQYLDTSVYKLIIFYETDDIEEAYKESARLKNYILKHKDIPFYLKSSYQRFLSKFGTLLKLSQKPEKTDIEIFADEMYSIKNVGLGNWLYEKVLVLKNKYSKM